MVLMLVGQLMGHGAAISRNERSRVFDNIVTERLWHLVRHGEVYVGEYGDIDETWRGLCGYFGFCNTVRLH